MPDGMAIRAGVITIFARSFPQVIEDGNLYVVEPPLFGFKDDGKQMFVATNREYADYLQGKFSKNNDLYYGDNKFSKNEIKAFLLRNENYRDILKRCAKDNSCESSFIELICANINKLGTSKKSVKDWDALIKDKYSEQFKAVWNDDAIEISGIRKGIWQMVELDDYFIKSDNIKDLMNLMVKNFNNVFGYKIKGVDEDKKLSISDVMKIFDKYTGKSKHRFKGIGEMEAEDLRDTCLDPTKDQRVVQITTKDISDSWKRLALWQSQKTEAAEARKKFVLDYTPDFKELST